MHSNNPQREDSESFIDRGPIQHCPSPTVITADGYRSPEAFDPHQLHELDHLMEKRDRNARTTFYFWGVAILALVTLIFAGPIDLLSLLIATGIVAAMVTAGFRTYNRNTHIFMRMENEYICNGDLLTREMLAYLLVHERSSRDDISAALDVDPTRCSVRLQILSNLDRLDKTLSRDAPTEFHLTDRGILHAGAQLRQHRYHDVLALEPDWSDAREVAHSFARGTTNVWECGACGQFYIEPAHLDSTNLEHWRSHECTKPEFGLRHRRLAARYRGIPVDAYHWLTRQQLILRLRRVIDSVPTRGYDP